MIETELSVLWFDHPSDLHGIDHTWRVVFWVEILAARLATDTSTTNWYSESSVSQRQKAAELAHRAALIHDMGRLHDGHCTEHGKRAAEGKRWVLQELGLDQPDAEWSIITAAVTRHCTRDSKLQATVDDLTLALLKDADALDRVRLYEYPNLAYLRFPFTQGYIQAAELLFKKTEGKNNGKTICGIGRRLVQIRP